MYINDVIQKAIVTEKSVRENDSENKYVFRVNYRASKGAIKNAVEKLFDVDVLDVRTMVMPGKRRRVLRTNRFTKTKKWKKAIVKIKDGQEIKFVTESK